jgi:hypothetical protein
MIFVARDQQERVLIAASIHSKACDLASIIDVLWVYQIQCGATRDQSIKVEDSPILPQESTRSVSVSKAIGPRDRVAHDLAFRQWFRGQ